MSGAERNFDGSGGGFGPLLQEKQPENFLPVPSEAVLGVDLPFPDISGQVKILKQASSLTEIENRFVDAVSCSYPYPVYYHNLTEKVWGDNYDRESSLWALTHRIRQKIAVCDEVAISFLPICQFHCYLVVPNLGVGRCLVPQDRLNTITRMDQEIQPLMNYCNQVQLQLKLINRGNREKVLVSRLTPSELLILNSFGEAYPNSVHKNDLIAGLWGGNYYACESTALSPYLFRLRGKIREFDKERFEIRADGQGNYSLSCNQ